MFRSAYSDADPYQIAKNLYNLAQYQEAYIAIGNAYNSLRDVSDSLARQQLIDLQLMRLECIKRLTHFPFVGFWGYIIEVQQFIHTHADISGPYVAHITNFYTLYSQPRYQADYMYNYALCLFDSINKCNHLNEIKNIMQRIMEQLNHTVYLYQFSHNSQEADNSIETIARLCEEAADWLSGNFDLDNKIACLQQADEYYQYAIQQYELLKRPAPFALHLSRLYMHECIAEINFNYAEQYQSFIKNYIRDQQLEQLITTLPCNEQTMHKATLDLYLQSIKSPSSAKHKKKKRDRMQISSHENFSLSLLPFNDSQTTNDEKASASNVRHFTSIGINDDVQHTTDGPLVEHQPQAEEKIPMHLEQDRALESISVNITSYQPRQQALYLEDYSEGSCAEKLKIFQNFCGSILQQLATGNAAMGDTRVLLTFARNLPDVKIKNKNIRAKVSEQKQHILSQAQKIYHLDLISSDKTLLAGEMVTLKQLLDVLENLTINPNKMKMANTFRANDHKNIKVKRKRKESQQEETSSTAEPEAETKSEDEQQREKTAHYQTNQSVVFANKRQKFSGADLAAAINNGDATKVHAHVGGSTEWVHKPIAGDSFGDTYLFRAVRGHNNTVGTIAALLPPALMSVASMKLILSPGNQNAEGDSLVQLAAKCGNLAALMNGIIAAALHAHKNPAPFVALGKNAIKDLEKNMDEENQSQLAISSPK